MPVARDATSREILFRNPFPVDDPRHAAAGEEVLEALLAGTDAEGFAGDRWLFGLARQALARQSPSFAKATVGEAYRLRNADRVEALFLASSDSPRAVPGLPGRWAVGLSHAIEVTRENAICFRSSPSLTRHDAPGWMLRVPEFPDRAVLRTEPRDVFAAEQEAATGRGLALLDPWLAGIVGPGPHAALGPIEVAEALKRTALPKSIRERAARAVPSGGAIGDVVAALGEVAASVEREEGECYARAAGRSIRSAGDGSSAAAGEAS